MPSAKRALSHIDVEDFIPTVTDVGRRHPITDVSGAGAGAGAADVFGALPPLQGLNRTAGLIDGASALLTHPFHNGPDGKPEPVIAVADIGKGRSVAIMTDTTWHWSLPQVGGGSGRTDAHRKLLANTLRWLIREPNKAGAWRVQATVTKGTETVGVDEEVFVVRQASLERLFGEARPELMSAIAAAGSGQARDADNVRDLAVIDHGRTRIHRQKTEAIWSTPAALLLIVGLAAIE